MRVSFHPDYRVDLPPTHPYPMGKYPLLHARLLRAASSPPPTSWSRRRRRSRCWRPCTRRTTSRGSRPTLLSGAERRRLGVPFTPRLWRRSRLAVHGTWLAAGAALADGLAGNLAGGTHHAFADHGEGFCVLNDVAVAIRRLRAEGRVRRALVVDLDVHQGNGTAAIFAGDPDVYTLSLHGERNYPARKERSSRDVALPDGTGDEAYLAALAPALAAALAAARPELAFLVAGVDVLAGDRYGRLALTEEGLRRRERHVVAALRDAGCPLAIVLGGGYAATTLRTSKLHALVFEAAAGRWRAERER